MPQFNHARNIYFIGEPSSKEDETSELSITSRIKIPQDFKKIIKEHNASNPFEDPEFPRTNESIGQISFDSAQGKQYPDWDGTYHWKRIKDFIAASSPFKVDVCFTNVVNGPTGKKPEYSKHDIMQGTIGDCWFLSSIAQVMSVKESIDPTGDLVMDLLVPANNLENNDSGAYHFLMMHDGTWIDVVVDDWCPCAEFAGPGKGWYLVGVKPGFTSDCKVKIWTIMLEKAYAKLNGSYHMIENNLPHNALEDLTGGLGYCLTFNPTKMAKPGFVDNLWNDLSRDQQSGNAIIVFGTRSETLGPDGHLGLHPDHAYTMTGVTMLEEAGGVKLVRMRNPWGRGEWVGDWSDGSPLWKSVSDETKRKLEFMQRDDGEFWIDYDNVMKLFSQVDVCLGIQMHQSKVGQQAKVVESTIYHGRWSLANGTAGGDANLAQNPQYLVYVGNTDATWDFDMMVALQWKTTLDKMSNLAYGYRVYWVDDPTFQRWKMVPAGPSGGYKFESDFFEAPENKLVKTAGSAYGFDDLKTYAFGRDVTDRFKVKAGAYLVVPTTAEPGTEAEFVLRVWYDKITSIGIVNEIRTISTTINEDGTVTITESVEK